MKTIKITETWTHVESMTRNSRTRYILVPDDYSLENKKIKIRQIYGRG